MGGQQSRTRAGAVPGAVRPLPAVPGAVRPLPAVPGAVRPLPAVPLLPRNVSKDIWGPIWWDHLQKRAIYWHGKATGEQVIREHRYLRSFFQQLPCEDCCGHATRYYWKNYPDLSSNETYHLWVHNFHNSVNQRLGKPHYSFEQYQDHYRQHLLVNNLI